MSPGLAVVLLVFALAYGAVGAYAVRRPLLGRLALREAVRRKGQSALVVGGLMVGTATITAALVAADSVTDSAVDSIAFRNFGRVDIAVTANGRFFPREVADGLAASPAVRGATDGLAAGIDLAVSAGDLDTRQGASRVTLVGFDPAAQEPFGAYTLVAGGRTLGDDLAPGEVLVSRLLAEKVSARPGDRLRLSVEAPDGTRETVLTVAGITRSTGPGAYTLGPAVFAPLETAQRVAGSEGINVVRVSAPGGVRDSLEASGRAAPVVRDAVRSLGDPASLEVREVKAAEAANAREFTVFIRAMLIGMSALVVAAGAALIVNLVGMLAEERRSRLGVLRALGLKRRGLVGLAVIEGALYSLAAGAIGVAVGAGAGRIVAGRFGRAFAEFTGEDFDFQFFFALKPATLVAGFVAGTLLSLGVVFLAARRTSRMTIAVAIRDLPEPPPERAGSRRRRVAILSVAALGGVAGLASGPFPRIAGGIVLVLVAASLLRSRLSPRAHATLTGLALAAWSFANIAAESGPEEDAGTFFLIFVTAMLTSVFGLTILASANLHVAETGVALLGRAVSGLRAVVRPPLAYLARRPVRTGLTTGVFAVVIGMLTLFAVFFVIFQPDYERFGGGYDVRVLSTGSSRIDLPAAVEPRVGGSLLLPTRAYIGPVRSDDEFSTTERAFVPLFEVSPSVSEDPPVVLEQRSDAYDSDRDAWAAVARDPSLVVGNFGVPDGRVTLVGPDGPVTYTVVGSQTFGLLDGIFGSAEALAPFGDAPLGATMLVDLEDPAAAPEVARTVERALFAQGVEADSVATLLGDVTRANRTFFSTIDVLMRMGLVVGLLSLGIIALRTVVERRHVIGVLRAIGYKRRAVMGGLLAEAATTAAIGAVVGAVVGLIMGYLFYRQEESQPGFGIDLASLGGVLALVFVAILLVTVLPAWRASRLPPAEAVRYVE